MAVRLLAVLWCILTLGHGVAASINMEVQPPQSITGMTETQALQCTFSFEKSSNFSSIQNLTVYKSVKGYRYVMAVANLTSSYVTDTGVSNSVDSVTGYVSATGDSFLRVQWTNPEPWLRGAYYCVAHGTSISGDPLDAYAYGFLEILPSLEALVRLLQTDLERLKEVQNQQAEQIEEQKRQQEEDHEELTKLKTQLTELKAQLAQ